MRAIDIKVATRLNEIHQTKSENTNLSRKELEPFEVGTKVWYRRPEKSGDKLDSRWLGPATIVERQGNNSYVIQIKPDYVMKSHRSFLKPYKEEIFIGQPTPLYFHQRTVQDTEVLPEEWNVAKIINHRKERDGSWKFLTTWEGFDPSEATWEPVENFFHRFNSDFIEYVHKHKLPVNVFAHLSAKDKPE